jgi:hypothetical protein
MHAQNKPVSLLAHVLLVNGWVFNQQLVMFQSGIIDPGIGFLKPRV